MRLSQVPLRYRVFGQCWRKALTVSNTRCPVALILGGTLRSHESVPPSTLNGIWAALAVQWVNRARAALAMVVGRICRGGRTGAKPQSYLLMDAQPQQAAARAMHRGFWGAISGIFAGPVTMIGLKIEAWDLKLVEEAKFLHREFIQRWANCRLSRDRRKEKRKEMHRWI